MALSGVILCHEVKLAVLLQEITGLGGLIYFLLLSELFLLPL